MINIIIFIGLFSVAFIMFISALSQDSFDPTIGQYKDNYE